MDQLTLLLSQLGINIASSAIYDLITLSKRPNSVHEIENYLASNFQIENAAIKAETIVTFLAKHGDIVISNTNIYASKEVHLQSSPGTRLTMTGSTSNTDKTSIQVGGGAQIIAQGGAHIRQGDDGSISIFA